MLAVALLARHQRALTTLSLVLARTAILLTASVPDPLSIFAVVRLPLVLVAVVLAILAMPTLALDLVLVLALALALALGTAAFTPLVPVRVVLLQLPRPLQLRPQHLLLQHRLRLYLSRRYLSRLLR
jgi:hypothetical protein